MLPTGPAPDPRTTRLVSASRALMGIEIARDDQPAAEATLDRRCSLEDLAAQLGS
ncbi:MULTISPECIES: hypothetical protein [Sorangium]|uniref:hypothetical protein n=1 Tax=Sorangium TaxID=39643 RepID=UPI003D9C030A